MLLSVYRQLCSNCYCDIKSNKFGKSDGKLTNVEFQFICVGGGGDGCEGADFIRWYFV